MRGSASPARTRTAALCLGLVLSHVVGDGSVLKVISLPGQWSTFPCAYHYEEAGAVPQLSVQWRGPGGSLLCHFIKHKTFQNCSAGYAVSYRPGSITLTIQHVSMEDFGVHVCSVSKRHEFSDYRVELAKKSASVTPVPTSSWGRPGPGPVRVLLGIVWVLVLSG